ncbi:MAG: hypothetical protein M3159_05695 [Actinomycetota bacterium]|nr:hypothetical protein [Actinomycetota bacterium]
MSDWTSVALPRMVRFSSDRDVRSGIASAASPLSRVEFIQGSGISSVVDATYFCALLRTSVNGLSSVRSVQDRRRLS